MHSDKIEILSVKLLDEQRPLVDALKQVARPLKLEFGWHYLLDLTWIAKELGSMKGERLMDAGAGMGVMQWYLASRGAEVTSVDRLSRASLPLRFRARYPVRGLRPDDLLLPGQVLKSQISRQAGSHQPATSKSRAVFEMAEWMVSRLFHQAQDQGRVLIYNQDLSNLIDIKENTFDAIVSVSAMEHNSPEDLLDVVNELLRVLKPGGVLLATLAAVRQQDWFHEPSAGWCYSEASLRRAFRLSSGAPSNYERYDELFAALRDCAELRDNLASFYFRSGENGMPWGKWDPQYQPVGVIKVKSDERLAVNDS